MVIFRVTSRRRASRDENLPGLLPPYYYIAHGSKVTRINFRKEGEGLGSRLNLCMCIWPEGEGLFCACALSKNFILSHYPGIYATAIVLALNYSIGLVD